MDWTHGVENIPLPEASMQRIRESVSFVMVGAFLAIVIDRLSRAQRLDIFVIFFALGMALAVGVLAFIVLAVDAIKKERRDRDRFRVVDELAERRRGSLSVLGVAGEVITKGDLVTVGRDGRIERARL